MDNLFFKLEEEIILNEETCFDEEKIKELIFKNIKNKLDNSDNKGFEFEKIVYEFFEYMNIPVIKTKKTRDSGIDGFIKLKIGFLGDLDLGVEIKHKLINSNDVDLFLTSLRNAEVKLGVMVCKDSRNLTKYELNSKIKSILFSRGITIKEKLLKEKVDINPVFILKLDEIVDVISYQIRAFVRGVYKKWNQK